MAWPNKNAEAERIVANFMVEVDVGDVDIAGLSKNIPSESLFYTRLCLSWLVRAKIT